MQHFPPEHVCEAKEQFAIGVIRIDGIVVGGLIPTFLSKKIYYNYLISHSLNQLATLDDSLERGEWFFPVYAGTSAAGEKQYKKKFPNLFLNFSRQLIAAAAKITRTGSEQKKKAEEQDGKEQDADTRKFGSSASSSQIQFSHKNHLKWQIWRRGIWTAPARKGHSIHFPKFLRKHKLKKDEVFFSAKGIYRKSNYIFMTNH